MEAYVVLALKKLETTWSSDKIVREFSTDMLDNVFQCFSEIAPEVKCRFMMAFLHVKKKKAIEDGFKNCVHSILKRASSDLVDWVRVTAEINLPYFLVSKESYKTPELDEAVNEVLGTLKLMNPTLVQPPLNYLPDILPFLDKSVIPKELDLKFISKNFHFKSTEQDIISSNNELLAPKVVKPQNNKRKFDAVAAQKRLDNINQKKAIKKGIQVINQTQFNPTGTVSNVTNSQKAVLTEILSSNSEKLTPKSRKIIEAYLSGETLKNQIETLVIAESTHKVDETHFKVEQTKLKIDFKNRQIKKVKAVKRYRVTPKTI